MKLWNLYVTDETYSLEYYIPIRKRDSVLLYESNNFESFKLVDADIPYRENQWPDEEIHTSGKHAQEAIKILFKYGVDK